MKITGSRNSLSEIQEDVVIVPVFEGDTLQDRVLTSLDGLTGGAVSALFESGEASGKRDRWTLIYSHGMPSARRVLLYGAGSLGQAHAVGLQQLAGAAIRALGSRGIKSAAFVMREGFNVETDARAIVEGAMLGQMNGQLHATKKEGHGALERLVLVADPADEPDFSEAIETGVVMAEATNLARRLAYEPGNFMTPSELARCAEKVAAQEGLGIEVLGEDEMKSLGMGALLAVSRGSAEPARLITMSYNPPGGDEARSSGEVIALVGKGITFDSGGISIKPAEKMEEMKYDMAGGAAVIAAMQVIARLKPAVRVLGLVPASENLPSGRAVKPGDVVRSLSGKTIEVINTDAEGRLILADAITYAINLGATHIIDIATLTGACLIALGQVRAAVTGTDQRLVDDLIGVGEQCGERLWQLPLDNEYGEFIRSDIADVKNIGNRTAGVISAAMFLKNFAGSLPWAHLDIAGTAWLEDEKPYMAKGATGFGVRLMANFVLSRAANKGLWQRVSI